MPVNKIVTLQLDGVTLKRFFDEIHSQTGVDFIYTPQQARYVEPITVNVTNADLGHVLDNVFRGKGLEYTVEGNIITLRYRRSVEKNTAPVAAKGESKITISGFVEDTSGRARCRCCGVGKEYEDRCDDGFRRSLYRFCPLSHKDLSSYVYLHRYGAGRCEVSRKGSDQCQDVAFYQYFTDDRGCRYRYVCAQGRKFYRVCFDLQSGSAETYGYAECLVQS